MTPTDPRKAPPAAKVEQRCVDFDDECAEIPGSLGHVIVDAVGLPPNPTPRDCWMACYLYDPSRGYCPYLD